MALTIPMCDEDAPNALFAQVDRKGWATTKISLERGAFITSQLENIASRFGQAVLPSRWQLTDLLSPQSQEQGRATSLSGKYGLGPFPLHCNTAFWPIPCRYVILACAKTGISKTATVLFDTSSMNMSDEEKLLATSALFSIRNGRRSFYSSILSPCRNFVRVDPGCLVPVAEDGIAALALYDRVRLEPALERVHWNVGDVLIIDNWRILHGREAVSDTDDSRSLARILIR
jgi:hypothetical protein